MARYVLRALEWKICIYTGLTKQKKFSSVPFESVCLRYGLKKRSLHWILWLTAISVLSLGSDSLALNKMWVDQRGLVEKKKKIKGIHRLFFHSKGFTPGRRQQQQRRRLGITPLSCHVAVNEKGEAYEYVCVQLAAAGSRIAKGSGAHENRLRGFIQLSSHCRQSLLSDSEAIQKKERTASRSLSLRIPPPPRPPPSARELYLDCKPLNCRFN